METKTPCPTCGCQLYQESGPCAGSEMLEALKTVYDRLTHPQLKPGSFKNPLPLGILLDAIRKAEGKVS